MTDQKERYPGLDNAHEDDRKVDSGDRCSHDAHTFPGGTRVSPTTSEDAHDVDTIVIGSPDSPISVYVVADGHGGPEGKHAAQLACRMVRMWTRRNARLFHQWFGTGVLGDQIDELFASIHQTFRIEMHGRTRGSSITPQGTVVSSYGTPVRGGATLSCVWVFTYEGALHVYTANVGDSEVMLIRLSGAGDSSSATPPHYTILTTEHSPSNQNEYLRIGKCENPARSIYDNPNMSDKSGCHLIYNPIPAGEEMSEQVDLRVPKFVSNPWGNGLAPKNVRFEPAVYLLAPTGQAIAVTRAIGDFAMHQHGMTHRPSHKVVSLKPDESCVLAIASDGLWDCWRYEAFAQRVSTLMGMVDSSISTLVTTVMEETKKTAIKEFGRGYDDTTLIAVHLSPLNGCSGGGL